MDLRQLLTRAGWLRAAVLGANDGILSTAGVLMGVAGASQPKATLLLSGVATLVAGACSMAAGEYVSVSAQADTELAADPGCIAIPTEMRARPMQASVASAGSFSLGALGPLTIIALAPDAYRVVALYAGSILYLAAMGALSAYESQADVGRSVRRILVFGIIVLVITNIAGRIFGAIG